MPNRLCLLLILAALFTCSLSLATAADTSQPTPVIPQKSLSLLAGGLQQHWYTWLTDDGHEDPRGVFKLQPDGTLHISGDGFGGLITRHEYADYHLVMEYRWGTKTYRNRVQAARDGGLLLHCQGPDGNFGGSGGKPGPWMTSVECQIIE
jgi:opacity protein-like surface antigen